MIQPVKNFVKLKDYYTFLLRQSIVWNQLKTHFIKEQSDLNQYNPRVTSLKSWFTENKTEVVAPDSIQKSREELADKLLVVQRRLDLLLAEYNRVEYYSLYKFDQIELPTELATAFFEYAVQEMKSEINYH